MRKKYKLFFMFVAFLFSGLIGKAGDPYVDSLLNGLEKQPDDTAKFMRYRSVFWEIIYNHPPAAYELSKKYLKLAKFLGNKKEEAAALNQAGIYYDIIGDHEESLLFYQKAHDLFEAVKDMTGLAHTLNNMGLTYQHHARYDKAQKFFFRSLKLHQEHSSKKWVALLYRNIATTYHLSNDIGNAKKYFLKSYEIYVVLNEPEQLTYAYENLAKVAFMDGDTKTALKYYQMGARLCDSLKRFQHQAYLENNISDIYLNDGKLKEAQLKAAKALEIFRRIGESAGIADALIVNAGIRIAQKQYSLALSLLNESEKIAEADSLPYILRNVYERKSEIYDETGDWKNSLMMQRKVNVLTRKIASAERSMQVSELEAKYENEKKQKKIAELTREQEESLLLRQKDQNLIWFISISLLFVIILSAFALKAYLNKKRVNELLNEQKLHIESINKDITDSIKYARRIQQSLLPTDKYIEKNLERLNK